jgi:hypothetical protein
MDPADLSKLSVKMQETLIIVDVLFVLLVY